MADGACSIGRNGRLASSTAIVLRYAGARVRLGCTANRHGCRSSRMGTTFRRTCCTRRFAPLRSGLNRRRQLVSVITTVLQDVPFAPTTQAFHSLIRLAYGVEAAHPGKIASGLASSISSHLPIDLSLERNRTADGIDAGFDQVAQALSGTAFQGTSITSRLRAVSTDVRFGRALLTPQPKWRYWTI